MKIITGSCIGLKSFCSAKEAAYRMKRPPTDWENLFTNGMSNKGLVYKIENKLVQLSHKNITTQSKTWAEDVKRYFSKEDMQAASRPRKKGPTAPISRARQANPTTR